jgi:hypothetical protein
MGEYQVEGVAVVATKGKVLLVCCLRGVLPLQQARMEGTAALVVNQNGAQKTYKPDANGLYAIPAKVGSLKSPNILLIQDLPVGTKYTVRLGESKTSPFVNGSVAPKDYQGEIGKMPNGDTATVAVKYQANDKDKDGKNDKSLKKNRPQYVLRPVFILYVYMTWLENTMLYCIQEGFLQ